MRYFSSVCSWGRSECCETQNISLQTHTVEVWSKTKTGSTMNQKNWFLIYRAQLSRHDGTPSCFSCTTAHVKRNEFAWKAHCLFLLHFSARAALKSQNTDMMVQLLVSTSSIINLELRSGGFDITNSSCLSEVLLRCLQALRLTDEFVYCSWVCVCVCVQLGWEGFDENSRLERRTKSRMCEVLLTVSFLKKNNIIINQAK